MYTNISNEIDFNISVKKVYLLGGPAHHYISSKWFKISPKTARIGCPNPGSCCLSSTSPLLYEQQLLYEPHLLPLLYEQQLLPLLYKPYMSFTHV